MELILINERDPEQQPDQFFLIVISIPYAQFPVIGAKKWGFWPSGVRHMQQGGGKCHFTLPAGNRRG